VDVCTVITGFVMIAMATGFFQTKRPVLSMGWRWTCAVLLALPGLGLVIAGIFTEAPSTLIIHWLVGTTLGLFFPVVTFLLVGLRLSKDYEWRGYGIYSIFACLALVAAVAFMLMAFAPGFLVAGLHIAGLAERLVLVEILAWYVVVGWRLFHTPVES
jgi:ABC-type multidrug transport system permease subunit